MCSFGYIVADSELSVEISRKCYIKASKPTGRQKKVMKTPFEKFSDAPEYPSIYPAVKGDPVQLHTSCIPVPAGYTV